MRSLIRNIFVACIASALASCGGSGGSTRGSSQTGSTTPPVILAGPPGYNYVGFFNQDGTPPELVDNMDFGVINAESPAQVESSLAAANGAIYKVRIDFSDILLRRKAASEIGLAYTEPSGVMATKVFPPLTNPKLYDIPSDTDIQTIMTDYLSVMAKHKDHVGVIFIADEPYLNGISKPEMERGIRDIRNLLDKNGLQNVKIGVTFASGMFDATFASFIDGQSGQYVENIDQYYQHGQDVISGKVVDYLFDITAYKSWLANIQTSRLTTYDAAGNMYTGGGIPSGVDVVGFDFYLSTILEDSIHENTLSWFAVNYPSAGCSQYAGITMTKFRTSLSFYQDGPQLVGVTYQDADRAALDAMYKCRMGAVLQMLKKASGNSAIQFQLISESSSNGVLEYYSNMTPKQSQPNLLIEARVLDEVKRAQNFYSENRNQFGCGLSYFVYNDAFDSRINLKINGASSLPSVISSIKSFSETIGSPIAHCD